MTDDTANIGLHSVELIISLEQYPTVLKIVTFEAIVNPCIITDFRLEVIEQVIDYTIHDPVSTIFEYNLVQKNACGYS